MPLECGFISALFPSSNVTGMTAILLSITLETVLQTIMHQTIYKGEKTSLRLRVEVPDSDN